MRLCTPADERVLQGARGDIPVTDDDIYAVEQVVGMGCGAWDMVDASTLITAIWRRLHDRSREGTRS